MKKTCLIIPCFNEAENLKLLINEIKSISFPCEIIVINDGSTDSTKEVASSLPIDFFIDLPFNMGIGPAMQAGFRLAKIENFDFAIKIDGDGQHPPSEILKLLEPLQKKEADISIGSRFAKPTKGYQSTFTRRLGIFVFQLVTYFLIGKKYFDITSGFRAYNQKAISFMSQNYPCFTYPEPEELILAHKNNLKITESPVEMRERAYGQSTFTFFSSIIFMFKVILSMLFIMMRKQESPDK